FLAGAGFLLLLWIGSQHMSSGDLTAPALVSLLLYAMLLNGPISSLANVYGQIQSTLGAADRLLEFFSVEPEPVSANKPDIGAVAGHITFRRVGFAYPGRESVLNGLDLVIDAGETVALTGENGAGKSTLAHILMRFVDPQTGIVLLDGTDIREVSLASLRRQIGLVAQNVLLLNGTIAENIAYARAGAGMDDIERAAIAAHAHEFISNLPQGYQTVIGDQGIKLSGGQRQRVSLARTLLKDPPILILDEATSMFDPEGEESFISESSELLRDRTVILITHRPASLALADRVLKMEHGKVFQ
ncbi:MAG: ATP-binding cassette subfamily B protein, partial [Halieaceae bacterium]